MTHRGYIMTLSLLLLAVLTLSDSDGRAEIWAGELGAVRQDVDAIKSEMETMKKQLGEIQKLLLQRAAKPAPADRGPVTISVGDGPALGSADAPITIVEFSDYQCPFCRKHFTDTFPVLKTGYIETGKVRYFFRDLPLDSIHSDARKAAEAAHCAGDQGKYWEMHDTMFTNQGALKLDNLRAFAGDIQLDLDAFNACLESDMYAKAVETDMAAGSAAGVTGTPGFFIGKTKKDDTIVATSIRGAQPAAVFSQVIDRLLEEKTP